MIKKIKIKKIAKLLILITLIISLVPFNEVEAKTKLNPKSKVIYVGDTVKIKLKGNKKKVKWTKSNSRVKIITKKKTYAKIKATKIGKVTITAKVGKKKYKCKITIKNKTTKKNNISTSKRNAVNKAKSYLSILSFSRERLIEQLEFEKFSHEDSVYGVDHAGANWNTQALQKAKEYLSYSSFSREGLIEQLKFEKFTTSQINYAMSKINVNWYEQALQKAKEYLSYLSFSREGLIEQLEYEGFTNDEATYAVNKLGF